FVFQSFYIPSESMEGTLVEGDRVVVNKLHGDPAGGKVTWTASQRPAGGRGWMLGYRVTYEVKGERHVSQAALAVFDVGRRKPSVLFVTVPDSRKRLWADIAPLMASARAL
ncbi:S26 family signal peptidase, partial [Streptosporangium sp. NPDC048865]|uniref:S26 family signal peptidase n=1 Tax=Streptosporangium sp. NPDC048865 TaxID=3155766 RepID=UPI0034142DB7